MGENNGNFPGADPEQDPLAWVRALYALLPNQTALSRCDTVESVADLYRDFVNRLTVEVTERAGRITKCQASHLHTVIDLALDPIEAGCGHWDPRQTLALLYPIEDIVVSLELTLSPRRRHPRLSGEEPAAEGQDV